MKLFPVVIWGMRREYESQKDDQPIPSHAYIHAGYRRAFEAAGFPTLWLDDEPESVEHVPDDAIMFVMDQYVKHMPVRKDLRYITHNCNGEPFSSIPKHRKLALQYFYDRGQSLGEYVNPWTAWNKHSRTLYQPWATDILPEDPMYQPVRPEGKTVFWIGSVWTNEQNQGNLVEFELLKAAVSSWGLRIVQRRARDDEHANLIRQSRLAPAIQGQWQVQSGYLPCRLFKNISYGHLGITNNPTAAGIFAGMLAYDATVEGAIAEAMRLSSQEWLDRVIPSMVEVCKEHTYANRVERIVQFL